MILKFEHVGLRVGMAAPGDERSTCSEISTVKWDETANSADLGGSSNDSKASFED